MKIAPYYLTGLLFTISFGVYAQKTPRFINSTSLTESTVLKASSLNLSGYKKGFADSYTVALKEDSINPIAAIQRMPNIDPKLVECIKNGPKSINDLTDGISIQYYQFKKGDEGKLGFLGFLNVTLTDKETVTIAEFAQTGTQYCNNEMLRYGIGARLMMKVTSHDRNAKLNTPQQITASVIYNKAEVVYNLKTFGIVGRGIVNLNKAGSVSEDTYKEFMEAISSLLISIYSDAPKGSNKPDYIVTPQPLFLNQQ